MSKTPVLTVKVNAEQFNAFTQNMANLSSTMTALMNQFTVIQGVVNQTSQNVQTLTNNMKNLSTNSQSMLGSIKQITTHFGKWFTLIYGIGAMLGTGAGIFGIQRLTEAIVQQQRRQLLLGGNQGDVQATVRAGKIADPGAESHIANIRAGVAGSIEERRGLYGVLGKYDPTKPAAELYSDFVHKLVEIGNRSKNPLLEAQARGAGAIVDRDTILRLTGPDRQKALEEFDKQRAQAPAPMSKGAMDTWTDLSQAWKNFEDTFINRMGEKFKPFADKLIEVTEWMTKWLAKPREMSKQWEEWHDAFVKSNNDWLHEHIVKPLEGVVKKFKESVSDPLGTFKGWIDELNTKIGELVSQIGSFISSTFWKLVNHIFGGSDDDPPPTVKDLNSRQDARRNRTNNTNTNTTSTSTSTSTSALTPKPSFQFPSQDNRTSSVFNPAVSSTSNAPSVSPLRTGSSGSVSPLRTGSSGFNLPSLPSIHQPISAEDPTSSAAFDRFNLQHGRPEFVTPGKQSALEKASPGAGGLSSLFAMNTSIPGGSNGSVNKRGALDTNNWQSTRTASLRIDNIAGANVYTSANMMS